MSMLLLALAPQAAAAIYGGNPHITLQVDRGAHDLDYVSAYISKIRVGYCGGGYTDYTINQTADLDAGFTKVVSGGDLCGVTVYWGSVVTIESDTFGLEYDAATTFVSIGSPIQPVALAPFDVVWGVIYGGNPELFTNIHY